MKYFVSVLFLIMPIFQVVQAQDHLPEDFDAVIIEDMKKWHAPGLGLAIVKDGKTILTKGYGVKSFKTMAPVNENTLFQAGSTTKAFAAMSIAMLIDQGKLEWDDPIIKHIPEFKMKDKYVQNNLTIRDALSHRSGVGALSNINMFIGKDISDTWSKMADIDQQAGFRENWDYNNTTFALSGRVIERVSGLKFHQFVKENILVPLGMDNTYLLDDEVKANQNRAEAHQHYKGIDYEIPYPYIEYTQSAGMMNSTATDMAKWLEFLLSGGEWQGEQLVSAENIKKMMKPQILLNPAMIYPAAATYNHNYYGYGLAWFVHDYRGHKIAMHTGSINGMIAIIAVVPEQKMGVYVFINSDHIEYRHALMYSVLDILLDQPKKNWSEDLYPVFHSENDTDDEAEKVIPAVASQALVGTYTLEGSYPLSITQYDGMLIGKVGIREMEIKKRDDNSYIVIDPDTREIPWENTLDVKLDDNGQVLSVLTGGLTYQKE